MLNSMKKLRNLLMKLYSSLPECGLSEDLLEVEMMMKKIKKNSQACGDLFPRLSNNQMLVFASIISGTLIKCHGFIGIPKLAPIPPWLSMIVLSIIFMLILWTQQNLIVKLTFMLKDSNQFVSSVMLVLVKQLFYLNIYKLHHLKKLNQKLFLSILSQVLLHSK